jgi:heme-degrading monooxygenase HmoA
VLLRVIVVEDADRVVVVTAYRTARIHKYWREP